MEKERKCPKCQKMIKIKVGSEDDELTDEEYLCEECRKINPFAPKGPKHMFMGHGPVVFSQRECSCGEKFSWYTAVKSKRNHGLLCPKCGKLTDPGNVMVAPWIYAEE